MQAIEVAKMLISDKVIEVRGDGTIWKLRNLNRMPLAAPRRLETMIKSGYLAVRISHRGKAYLLLAHRLVWEILRAPIPGGMTVNHLDGCKTNNHPENLEVVTQSDNNKHAYRVLGRAAPPQIPRPVLDLIRDQATALRGQGLPYAEIAARLGVSQTTAFRAARTK